jgi:ornithine cyclodeaminase/alanine dehydrogenase-like protein (mu-crystallin family)
VGARILARAESETVGIIGSGGMARSYLDAFVESFPIRRVRVFSPDAGHRSTFASEMSARHDIDVVATEDPEDAVRGADIVALCASAVEPVFQAAWLAPGMHVTDVTRAWNGNQTPVVDSLPPEGMYARGGILSWVAGGSPAKATIPSVPLDPDQLAMPTLADVVAGRARGRTTPDETSFFHNVGASAEAFAAIAATIYESARAAGVGREIPTEWFIEDVRD